MTIWLIRYVIVVIYAWYCIDDAIPTISDDAPLPFTALPLRSIIVLLVLSSGECQVKFHSLYLLPVDVCVQPPSKNWV